jgi:hypothetical protein
MTNATVPETQEVVKTSRYSVSRKGMGGRKPKYNEEQLKAMLVKRDTEKVSLKAQCRELGLPYVSVNAAIDRMGLKTKTETISA